MKRKQCDRPAIEALEARTLLSVAGGAPPQPAAQVASAALHHHLSLCGTIQGTWSRVFTNPDIGGAQALLGSGTVRPLGGVDATGTLHAPGFVARGRTTGSLTLSNARGSVTLELVGTKTQRGFSGPPASLRYTVVRGTGPYADASGTGTTVLRERPETGPPPGAPGTFTPDYLIAPSFTLTLHS